MTEAHASPVVVHRHATLHRELVERRKRLVLAADYSDERQVTDLLDAVDDALGRIEKGTYGICEVCDGLVEPDRLAKDPLTRVCLECLSPSQRRALEHDLSLASSIQRTLLPEQDFEAPGWAGHYVYQPHGAVSGDFCDVITRGKETIVFLGDVSGKGVSAALLMSHLSAIIRGLAGSAKDLVDLVEQANRLFCTATPTGSYATLVAVRLGADGTIELVNAGHVPPIVQNGRIERLPPDGVPLGLFHRSSYTSQSLRLQPGDRIVLVTDGVIESTDGSSTEYGLGSLSRILAEHPDDDPANLATRLLADLARFRSGNSADDDTTLMVLRRSSAQPRTA
ncbi:MAG: SpoIIE family protein phosphatase [Acidobacteria bacterium]|nr:SpoIIE family protein phosphatase [Acidobacteriota bacterium]